MALKWPDKDPDECLDYTLELGGADGWLLPGRQISDAVVESITETVAGTQTSPRRPLAPPSSPHVFLAASGDSSPSTRIDSIVVWLEEGEVGATYEIKIVFYDDANVVSPEAAYKNRRGVRRVQIKVKEK